jgi:hypothetical protein
MPGAPSCSQRRLPLDRSRAKLAIDHPPTLTAVSDNSRE